MVGLMPEISGWRPVKETHAIHQASATVIFGQAVGDVLFKRVDAQISAEAERLGLTEREPIVMGVPEPLRAFFGQQAGGTEHGAGYRKRETPEFFSEQVQATRDTLRYEQWEYTRWAPFKDRARGLLSNAVDRFSEVSSLLTVNVNYVDIFHAIEEGDQDVSAVLDRTSPAVSAIAFRPTTQWHTHSGWFEYPDEVTRRLFNMNVDIVDIGTDSGMRRAIQITTQATDQFHQAGRQPLPDLDANWEFVERHLQDLHVSLKGLLRTVLTPAAADAISLG